MPEPSTPSARSAPFTFDGKRETSTLPESLAPDQISVSEGPNIDRYASDNSKPPRLNESVVDDTNVLLVHEVKNLHLNTPNTPATGDNMDSPIMTTSNNFGSNTTMLTPPSTPKSANISQFPQLAHTTPVTPRRPQQHRRRSSTDPSTFLDVANLSFDPAHAQLLGTGLWSKVYKLTPFLPSPSPPISAGSRDPISSLYTPPSTPQSITKPFPSPQLFAIKVATRPDALPIFESEACILRFLQTSPSEAERYVVPFVGFSPKSQALIFQCANAGSLESLIQSSASRSPAERLRLFATLAPQLVAGLAFLHAKGVVHADIKPANILLSHDERAGGLRARFADFGASFLAGRADDLPKNAAGGTWEYMAPEQLVRDATLSTPTFASDVYSLGVSLLSLLGGGSCFEEVASSMFMLREAVKVGDVLGFATRSRAFEQSVEAVEREWKTEGGEVALVALVKGALSKKREERLEAAAWRQKFVEAGLDW